MKTFRYSGIVLGVALAGRAEASPELAFYGDVNYTLTAQGDYENTTSSFGVPNFEIFASEQIDKLSFLAETLFEVGPDNAFVLDIERVEIGYLVNDKLRIRAGRFHTAIGIYNDGYHHGAYFMLPVGRPAMVAFEDDGGLIPAHNIGLHADGRLGVTDETKLHYDVELVNGRGPNPEVIQNASDSNRAKAVNVRLRLELGGALDGLIVGGNAYFDSIAADPTRMSPRMREWIAGGHVTYVEGRAHVVSEVLWIRHDEIDGPHHDTFGAFAEAGYRFGDLTPYGRYQRVQFPSADPYFADALAAGSFHDISLGVKHSTSDHVCLKLDGAVRVFDMDGIDPALSVVAQSAFAF